MKHWGKLVFLGSVLVATTHYASAISFTGSVTAANAPAGDIGSTDNSVFDLSSVSASTAVLTGTSNLSSFVSLPQLFTFSTTAIASSGPGGVELYAGQNTTTTETAAFWATSYNSLMEDVNGDYNLTAFGYFSDREGNHTPGFDNITFDSGVVNNIADTTTGGVTEILTATPTPTPEPSSVFLMGSGLLGLAGLVRRRCRA